MKTIFIALPGGWVVSNVLQNPAFVEFKKKHRVILYMAVVDEKLKQEFGGENVIFKELKKRKNSFGERILRQFHHVLVYNKTVEIQSLYGIPGKGGGVQRSYLRSILIRLIFKPLSRFIFLRDFFRWLDYYLFPRHEYDEDFDEFKPALVFASNINDDSCVNLVKNATAKGIYSIVMPQSWDNLSKGGFRIKGDLLVVWNDFMHDQAIKFQNYKDEEVKIIGVPQFDWHVREDLFKNREQFCNEMGLDPERKIILFGSAGKLGIADKDVTAMITKAIQKRGIKIPAQLLIRPHYGWPNDVEKFNHLVGQKHAVIDRHYKPSKFRDSWDYSIDRNIHLADSLKYCSMLITTFSTLNLDAACFDKALINIYFDGYEKKPFKHSVRRWYGTDWTQEVLATGAVSLAKDEGHLIELINKYLSDSTINSEGRERLRNRFCYKIDGQSGKRLFAVFESKM